MSDLNMAIRKADTATLWELVTDVAAILKTREYVVDKANTAFMFWYQIYKELETEINRRLVIGDTEG